jgi:hypothetical protein
MSGTELFLTYSVLFDRSVVYRAFTEFFGFDLIDSKILVFYWFD